MMRCAVASIGMGRRLRARSCIALGLAGLMVSSSVSARIMSGTTQANVQHHAENGEMLAQAHAAITGSVTYNSDANAVVGGGSRTGAAYLQRIGLLGDADLGHLVGWQGATMHVSVHAIAGRGLSDCCVGNILAVSGLEAKPALRLFNLWIQQELGKRATLRIGQFTAGQEFAISETANQFVNSTFGWPGSFATDLPSGGPAYPLAAPGARLAVNASDRLSIRLAVFAGDPAGPGTGDPQRRDLHGFNGFRLKGAPFVIAEVARTAGDRDDPAWSITLGGWVHFDRFADLRLDTGGHSLVSPRSTGQPQRHDGDYAVYALADGRLWRSGSRSIHGFVRASASPADRNPVDLYLDGGLSMTGPFKARPGDTVGIGFAIARISPRLRSLARERAALAGQPPRLPGFEGAIEASYQLKLNAGLYLQPNVQWILHPSGALLADDAGVDPPVRRAVVLGLRTSLRL